MMFTLEDVEKGEELVTDYCPGISDLARRQTVLYEQYGIKEDIIEKNRKARTQKFSKLSQTDQNKYRSEQAKSLVGSDMIDGKYHVIKQLDTGTFGDVYQIREKSTGNMRAAKVEILNPKKSVKVERELLFMDALKDSKFVPTVYDTHKIRYDHYIKKRDENDNEIEDEAQKDALKVKATVLIMDLLGPNLHDLLD